MQLSVCSTCQHRVQVMLEAYVAGKQQAGGRFDAFAPCGAETGAGLSVRTFVAAWDLTAQCTSYSCMGACGAALSGILSKLSACSRTCC